MTQWYVKDLSKLTQVSVQTLHHYDHIGLLAPSIRQTNGYRLYSEKDLLKLQQIIALKYFGFNLSQIKTLLHSEVDMVEHLTVQSKFLEEKAKTLHEASSALKNVISDCGRDKSISWESIIKLIEVYRMTQHLENAWVKEIFSPNDLKEYTNFEAELNSSAGLQKKSAFEKNWSAIITEIRNNLEEDPETEIGYQLGKKCMECVNALYGKKYAHLRTKMFEQGFGEGKGLQSVGMTPEIVTWLDTAICTYWHRRIDDLISCIDNMPSSELVKKWHLLLDDMYGEDSDRKVKLLDLIFEEKILNDKAKAWLNQFLK